MVQVAEVPVQPPLHPPKLKVVAGEAVSVTEVPAVKLAKHVVGQLRPAGLLVTVPVPPVLVTVIWKSPGGGGGFVGPPPAPFTRPLQPPKNSAADAIRTPDSNLVVKDMDLVFSPLDAKPWMNREKSRLDAPEYA